MTRAAACLHVGSLPAWPASVHACLSMHACASAVCRHVHVMITSNREWPECCCLSAWVRVVSHVGYGLWPRQALNASPWIDSMRDRALFIKDLGSTVAYISNNSGTVGY
jgi:hypothetical protein